MLAGAGLSDRPTSEKGTLAGVEGTMEPAGRPEDLFELLEQLGKGSYGAVYKARHRPSGTIVAVKVIPLSGEDEEGLEDIRREIAVLQECVHPNVVRYFGSFMGNEYLWIVMEHCGGGSVRDILSASNRPLREAQIAYLCGETLKGLVYLHSIFKVHRDIKCSNILLTESGGVKLADFGVAAQLTRTMSKRNTFIGTPHWMAPEVIQESRYDGKVDVWALGISAIEMAEIQPPRHDVHPMRVIFMITREPSPRLASHEARREFEGNNEAWSAAFHDFINQCLRKETSRRPTATELLPHRFLQSSAGSGASLVPMITQAKQWAARETDEETRRKEQRKEERKPADPKQPAAPTKEDSTARTDQGSTMSTDTGSVIVKDTTVPPPAGGGGTEHTGSKPGHRRKNSSATIRFDPAVAAAAMAAAEAALDSMSPPQSPAGTQVKHPPMPSPEVFVSLEDVDQGDAKEKTSRVETQSETSRKNGQETFSPATSPRVSDAGTVVIAPSPRQSSGAGTVVHRDSGESSRDGNDSVIIEREEGDSANEPGNNRRDSEYFESVESFDVNATVIEREDEPAEDEPAAVKAVEVELPPSPPPPPPPQESRPIETDNPSTSVTNDAAESESGLDPAMLMRMFVGRELTDAEEVSARDGGGIPTVAYVPPAESEPVVSNEPETQQTRAVADPGPTAPEASIDDDALIGDKSDPMAGRSFFDENPDVRRLLPDGSLDIAGLLRAYAGIEIVEKAEVPRYSAETHAWHPANVMRYSLKNFLVDHETGAPLNPRADHTMSLESYLKTAMRRDEPPPLPRSDEELRAEAAEYSAYLDELDSDENKFMDPTNDSDTDSEIDPGVDDPEWSRRYEVRKVPGGAWATEEALAWRRETYKRTIKEWRRDGEMEPDLRRSDLDVRGYTPSIAEICWANANDEPLDVTDNLPLDATHEEDATALAVAYCDAAHLPRDVAEAMLSDESGRCERLVRCLAWKTGRGGGASALRFDRRACRRLRRALVWHLGKLEAEGNGGVGGVP